MVTKAMYKYHRLDKQNLLHLPSLQLGRGASPDDPLGSRASGAADLICTHPAAEGAVAAFSATLLAAIFCAKMLFLSGPTFPCKHESHASSLSSLPTLATNKCIDLTLKRPSDQTLGRDTEKLLATTYPVPRMCYSFFNTV